MTTAEEIACRVFDEFDRERAGTLDSSEIRFMLEETFKGLNYCVTDQGINDTLEFMKTNKDGEISREEFVSMVKKAFANKST